LPAELVLFAFFSLLAVVGCNASNLVVFGPWLVGLYLGRAEWLIKLRSGGLCVGGSLALRFDLSLFLFCLVSEVLALVLSWVPSGWLRTTKEVAFRCLVVLDTWCFSGAPVKYKTGKILDCKNRAKICPHIPQIPCTVFGVVVNLN
jgi:hypothetical protein